VSGGVHAPEELLIAKTAEKTSLRTHEVCAKKPSTTKDTKDHERKLLVDIASSTFWRSR
jgi:hypothetical protein